MPLRVLALCALLLLAAGCEGDLHDDAQVFVGVNASEQQLFLREVAYLTSTITTENGARVKLHAWELWHGASAGVFLDCPSCFNSNISFYEPGRYTISFVVVWWDRDGDEHTQRYFLDFLVHDSVPG